MTSLTVDTTSESRPESSKIFAVRSATRSPRHARPDGRPNSDIRFPQGRILRIRMFVHVIHKVGYGAEYGGRFGLRPNPHGQDSRVFDKLLVLGVYFFESGFRDFELGTWWTEFPFFVRLMRYWRAECRNRLRYLMNTEVRAKTRISGIPSVYGNRLSITLLFR